MRLRKTCGPRLTGLIVSELGGPTATAAACGVRPASVYWWLEDGMPEARYLLLRAQRPDLRVWSGIRNPKKGRADDRG